MSFVPVHFGSINVETKLVHEDSLGHNADTCMVLGIVFVSFSIFFPVSPSVEKLTTAIT